MKLGDYLRDQRNNKGWTQPEAAEHCGIEQSYLSKLENGKAYPSEEVFERLSSAYGLDLSDVCEQVADPELEKMRGISAIRSALNGKIRKGLRAYRLSLLLGAVLIVLGSGLLAHWGWVTNSPKQTYYVYESKGVVLEGESPYLFNAMPSSRELARMEGRHYETYFLSQNEITAAFEQGQLSETDRRMYEQRLALRDRLDYNQQERGSRRGELYITNEVGGTRTYTLVDQRIKQTTLDTAAYFIFGIMLVVGGLLSFFVGARWR